MGFSPEEYQLLLEAHMDEALTYSKQSLPFLKETVALERPFGLYQPERNVIVIVQPSASKKAEAALGFPFPVARLTLPELPDNGEITVCFRNGRLRNIQRQSLLRTAGYPVNCVTVEQMQFFAKTVCTGRLHSVYINPYAFLGDSLIGLYFRDQINHYLGIKNNIVLSLSHSHQAFLGNVYPASDKDSLALIQEDGVIIAPDLIDDHLPNTLAWIERLKGGKRQILIIGRGILIDNQNKVTYVVDEEDPLLRDSNIELYMDDCLLQFIPAADLKIGKNLDDSRAVVQGTEAFINPFASTAIRDLPLDFILTLIEALTQKGISKIYISNGVSTSEKDKLLIEKIRTTTASIEHMIEYKWFNDLSDMAHFVKNKTIGYIFSPDTSVPHLFNSLNLPVFTIYKSGFWDKRSIQSLASDSPLGFSRFQKSQIPILIGKEIPALSKQNWLDIFACYERSEALPAADALLSGYEEALTHDKLDIDKLQAQYKQDAKSCGAGTLLKSFDIEYFIKALSDLPSSAAGRLYHSLFRIAPLYKWIASRTC